MKQSHPVLSSLAPVRRRQAVPRLLLLFSVWFLSGLVLARAAERPKEWAAPVPAKHLENAYKLDAKLYRSAQPSAKGFKEASQLGITEVLNLRDNHSDHSEAKGLNLTLHRIKSEADELNEQQLIEAMRIIKASKGPVLVHCWHGSDRTGAVCAVYRVVFNDWSKEAALDEMTNGGFGYHKMYKNIATLIREIDVSKVKSAVFAP